MATSITDEGRNWARDVAIGDRDETISTVAVGTGTRSPSPTDESLDNQEYISDDSNTNVTVEATSGVGNFRCIISVTGGSEVSADASITEFGIYSSDGVLLMREVRSEVIIETGDTKTFEIPMKFDI